LAPIYGQTHLIAEAFKAEIGQTGFRYRRLGFHLRKGPGEGHILLEQLNYSMMGGFAVENLFGLSPAANEFGFAAFIYVTIPLVLVLIACTNSLREAKKNR
jgi:hypothetical protein